MNTPGLFKEALVYSVWTALLVFFEAGQDARVQPPLEKRLALCQTKKLGASKIHLISVSYESNVALPGWRIAARANVFWLGSPIFSGEKGGQA